MLRKLFPFLREEEQRWEHLDNSLTTAFSKVRQDTQNLFSWISYFHQHLMDHRKETHHLRQKFDEQSHYIRLLHQQTQALEKRLALIENKPAPQPQIVHIRENIPEQIRTKSEPDVNQIRTEPEPISNVKRPRFEEKVLTRIRTKKKPYIMQKVLDIIGTQSVSTKELERIIVEEQQLCGRTSFYSYLRELRLKKQISIDEKEFSKVIVRI